MKQVYAVVGVPGSGKSWVCAQLGDKFTHLPHDAYIGKDYVTEILKVNTLKPILIEIPFSISQIKEPLEASGCKVNTVFIIEDEGTLMARYAAREGKTISKGHLTRQVTYSKRAEESNSFKGTALQVLMHLRNLA